MTPSGALRRRVWSYKWGVSLYAFGWTWSLGFDMAAKCWWFPIWRAKGYFGDWRG